MSLDNNNLIEGLIPNGPDINKNHDGLIKPMDFDVRTKSIEEKMYIILYKIDDGESDEIYNSIYSVCIGRTEAYSDIKNKLISGLNVDVHRSIIITETKQTESSTGDRKYFLIPYDECISVYSFCISIGDYYSDDEFDIEDYNNSDVPETPQDIALTNPMYMTKENMEFRKLFEESLKRDKFIDHMKHQLESDNI